MASDGLCQFSRAITFDADAIDCPEQPQAPIGNR